MNGLTLITVWVIMP